MRQQALNKYGVRRALLIHNICCRTRQLGSPCNATLEQRDSCDLNCSILICLVIKTRPIRNILYYTVKTLGRRRRSKKRASREPGSGGDCRTQGGREQVPKDKQKDDLQEGGERTGDRQKAGLTSCEYQNESGESEIYR